MNTVEEGVSSSDSYNYSIVGIINVNRIPTEDANNKEIVEITLKGTPTKMRVYSGYNDMMILEKEIYTVSRTNKLIWSKMNLRPYSTQNI